MVLIQFSRGKKYYRPKLDNTKDILRFLQKYPTMFQATSFIKKNWLIDSG
jgi:hypothetical protein